MALAGRRILSFRARGSQGEATERWAEKQTRQGGAGPGLDRLKRTKK